ncbi:MAG: hypothetical protein HC819_14025 [Cyclobacteriaceae bacterium]|nr:hypothetical protein [Cyclobacteriaceae bacterium]
MKRPIFVLLLFCFISNISLAQYYTNEWSNEFDKRDLYERKIESYGKMKKTGGKLAAIGGAATIVGIILVSSADWETDAYGNTQTSDAGGAVGLLTIMVGVPTAITGIVLGAVGKNKQNQYVEKLNRLDLTFHRNNDFNSIRLVYRF